MLVGSLVACSQPSATTIESPLPKRPAEFEVGPVTFAPATVMVGDSVTVTATVKNIGDVAGTYTAIFSLDGQQTDKKDITIEPGGSKEVSFQLSKTTPGSYKLAIGNSSIVMTVYNWSPCTIQYDESDGSMMGIYVSGENGHIVHFTPPAKAFRIQKIRIFGTTKILNTSEFDTKHVTVRIWNKERNSQLWSQDFPWRLFMGDATWREIKVPDIRVNDDFYVELVTHSTPTAYKPGTEIPSLGGEPIDFAPIVALGGRDFAGGGQSGPLSVVLIGFDYPQSYIDSPSNRPETRSGYSHMGKLIDPGQGRLKGIRWLIRVEGEGSPGS